MSSHIRSSMYSRYHKCAFVGLCSVLLPRGEVVLVCGLSVRYFLVMKWFGLWSVIEIFCLMPFCFSSAEPQAQYELL